MESLYNKYRPRQFSDILGNDTLIEIIKGKILKGNFPHVCLLSGSPGNGKTTTARIIAKALNCPNRKAGEPCNQCDSCLSADKESNLNIEEINAGLENKVVDVEALIEKSAYASIGKEGKRVIILDECHRMRGDAQSCLLKILEDTPEHIYFLLCTSEARSMSEALQSRSAQFRFNAPGYDDKFWSLKDIAQQENITISDDCLSMIIRNSDGMRETIQLLDQCQDLAEITPEKLADLLGDIPENQLLGLILAIAQRDIDKILLLSEEIFKAKLAPDQIGHRFLSFYKEILRLKISQAEAPKNLQPIIKAYDLAKLEKHFRILMQFSKAPSYQAQNWLECLILSLAYESDFSLEGIY